MAKWLSCGQWGREIVAWLIKKNSENDRPPAYSFSLPFPLLFFYVEPPAATVDGEVSMKPDTSGKTVKQKEEPGFLITQELP